MLSDEALKGYTEKEKDGLRAFWKFTEDIMEIHNTVHRECMDAHNELVGANSGDEDGE